MILPYKDSLDVAFFNAITLSTSRRRNESQKENFLMPDLLVSKRLLFILTLFFLSHIVKYGLNAYVLFAYSLGMNEGFFLNDSIKRMYEIIIP